MESGETGRSGSTTSPRLGLVPGPGKDRISELRTCTFEESGPVTTTGPRHLEQESGGPVLSIPGEAAETPMIALCRQMN